MDLAVRAKATVHAMHKRFLSIEARDALLSGIDPPPRDGRYVVVIGAQFEVDGPVIVFTAYGSKSGIPARRSWMTLISQKRSGHGQSFLGSSRALVSPL